MKKYLKYLKYVLKHKWFVMLECFRCGIYWRGLMHDMSKLMPDEFFPYANFFYGNKQNINNDDKFDFAWLLHQKRNKHHWQSWILPQDNNGIKILEMQEPYITEMICDWIGVAKALGKVSPKNDKLFETRIWWGANNNEMMLHYKTKAEIIKRLESNEE